MYGRVKKDWDDFVYIMMTLITYDVWWAVFRLKDTSSYSLNITCKLFHWLGLRISNQVPLLVAR